MLHERGIDVVVFGGGETKHNEKTWGAPFMLRCRARCREIRRLLMLILSASWIVSSPLDASYNPDLFLHLP